MCIRDSHGAAGDDDHDAAHGEDEAVPLGDEGLREEGAQHEVLLPVEPAVHDDGHQHGDEDLQRHLQPAEEGGGRRPAAVAPETFLEMPEGFFRFLLFDDPRPPVRWFHRKGEAEAGLPMEYHLYFIGRRRILQGRCV